MNRALWLLGLLAFLQSCQLFSDTEKAGMEQVNEVYGGSISGKKSSGTEGNFFTISISGTDIPIEIDPTLEVAAHNVAVIIYRNLTQEERDQYHSIQVEVVTSRGTIRRTVDYPIIKLIMATEAQCRKDMALMENGDYIAYLHSAKQYLQNQFQADSFSASLQTVFQETGELMPPVFLGVDTMGHNDSIVGSYIFLYNSATDSSARLMYSATYLMTGQDSMLSFAAQSLLQD